MSIRLDVLRSALGLKFVRFAILILGNNPSSCPESMLALYYLILYLVSRAVALHTKSANGPGAVSTRPLRSRRDGLAGWRAAGSGRVLCGTKEWSVMLPWAGTAIMEIWRKSRLYNSRIVLLHRSLERDEDFRIKVCTSKSDFDLLTRH